MLNSISYYLLKLTEQIKPILLNMAKVDNIYLVNYKVSFQSKYSTTIYRLLSFHNRQESSILRYYTLMKQLSSALKIEKSQQSRISNNKSRVKSKSEFEKWSLDPDFIEEGPEGTKQKFKLYVSGIIKQKFEGEKYLEEETFKDLIIQLTASLPYISCQLERLIRIQEALEEIGESFFGDIKNYVKHFQSLLDAKIRKLKKKEKKAELIQFERMAALEGKMKRKNPVSYINEDQKPVKFKLKRKNIQEQRRQSNSKRSFGTMNSGGSNQNESGSGKNKSGSDSKSGQANALAVLLENVTRIDDKKKQKDKQSQKQSYNFSSVLSCTVTVRQRNMGSKHIYSSPSHIQKSHQPQLKADKQLQKDEAFIFHRPKQVRKGK